MNLKMGKKLNRKQMQSIIGGLLESSPISAGACTASCPDGTIKTCSGNRCKAVDGEGCSADTPEGKDEKSC